MDDINFEELDKAVNSALQQSTPQSAPDDNQTDSGDGLTPVVNTTPSQAPAAPSVVPRRRGQFMDMVHPSSDMIKQPVTARPNRQAASLQPLDPAIVEAQPVEPVSEDTAVSEFEPEVPEVASDDQVNPPTSAAQPEWPDPLDVMEQTEDENHETQPSPIDAEQVVTEPEAVVGDDYPADSEEKIEPVEADSGESAEEEVPVTPFIPGAEPEKRPLGAFTDTPPSAETGQPATDEIATSDDVVSETDDSASPLDETVHEATLTPLVHHELAPEVVSVESDDPALLDQEASDPAHTTETAESGGIATSIPPQYKQTTATTDTQDHPVFDTKDYHQPLTPPVKKGHTGLTVTLIFLLLALLGGGAWYAIAVLKLI